jgi:hypothetical protein
MMTEINAIFSKISDVLTKDFLAGSLVPALLFIVGALVATGTWLGWTTSLVWADQLSGATLAIYGSFIFIAIVGLAYLLNAMRELMIAFWTGEALLCFPLWWLIELKKIIVRWQADRELSEWYSILRGIAEEGGVEWAVRPTIRVSLLSAGEVILRLRGIEETLPESTDAPARATVSGFVKHLKEGISNRQSRVTDRQVSEITRRWLKSFRANINAEDAKRAITALQRDLGRSLKESVEQMETQTREEKAKEVLRHAWNDVTARNKKRNDPSLSIRVWQEVETHFLKLREATNLRSLNEALARTHVATALHAKHSSDEDDPAKARLELAYHRYIAAAGIREQIRLGHGEDTFLRRFQVWCRAREPRANALGNLLASYNLYPRMAYSFDGDFNWLKVGGELKENSGSDPLLQRIEDSRLSLYFCITSATLALFSGFGLIALRYNSITSLEIGFVPIVLVFLLTAFLYQAALVSAAAMSGSLRTAFDRYAGNAESRRALEPAEQGTVSQAFFSNLDDPRDFLWRRLINRLDASTGSARRVALATVGRKPAPLTQQDVPPLGIIGSFGIFLLIAGYLSWTWWNWSADASASNVRWRLTAIVPVSPCTTLTKETAEATFLLRPMTADQKRKDQGGSSRQCYAAGDGIWCTGEKQPEPDEAVCVASLLGVPTPVVKQAPPKLPEQYVIVRRPESKASDQVVSRGSLAGYTILPSIAADQEVTTDKLAVIMLVGRAAPADDKAAPQPPLPSKIELVASGSVALTPSAPTAPIQFGSLEVKHTGALDFGALSLNHSGEINLGNIEVGGKSAGGYRPNGQPAGALFFPTCSVEPYPIDKLTEALNGALDGRSTNLNDATCSQYYTEQLVQLKLTCSNPKLAAGDCVGASEWLIAPSSDGDSFNGTDSFGKLTAHVAKGKMIEVFGYADQEIPDISSKLNAKLSLLRAKVTAAYLASGGITSREMIRAHGFGDERPLVPASQKGRQLLNRRVEVFQLDADPSTE